jgi:hypothetical protein
MDFKKSKTWNFKNSFKFRNSFEKTFSNNLVPEPNKFWNSPQRQVPRPTGHDPTTYPQTTLNKEFANALHAIVVKEVANALTLQCYRRQEFEKISDAPPLPCQRCHTAKLKVIADAPISQSCHSH